MYSNEHIPNTSQLFSSMDIPWMFLNSTYKRYNYHLGIKFEIVSIEILCEFPLNLSHRKYWFIKETVLAWNGWIKGISHGISILAENNLSKLCFAILKLFCFCFSSCLRVEECCKKHPRKQQHKGDNNNDMCV